MIITAASGKMGSNCVKRAKASEMFSFLTVKNTAATTHSTRPATGGRTKWYRYTLTLLLTESFAGLRTGP
jgi:hypothetical protein